MARKPDVFEQMVHVAIKKVTGHPDLIGHDGISFVRTLSPLLRRYHAKVRRMVACYARNYPVAEEMLRNLDRIKKGTR